MNGMYQWTADNGWLASAYVGGITTTYIKSLPDSSPRTVRKYVAQDMTRDADDVSAQKFAAKLSAAIARVPQEYRKQARIRFDTEYESSDVEVSCYYDRKETKSEVAKRLARERRNETAAQKEREDRERELLANLMKKYIGPTP